MQDMMKENLINMGCPECVVSKMESAAGDEQRLKILRSYRKELLEDVHREQQKLQDLDYIIFQIRKERE